MQTTAPSALRDKAPPRRSDPLLTPFRLKGLTLRNRIMSTSHAATIDEGGLPKERYQRYHEEKAKGGIALTMFGGSSVVSPDCPAVFGQLDVSDDRVVPYLKQMSERVHRHGAALMCQITHMGRRARWDVGPFLVPVAPSPVREPEHRTFPRTIEDWDIRRITEDFGQAARRCKEGDRGSDCRWRGIDRRGVDAQLCECRA